MHIRCGSTEHDFCQHFQRGNGLSIYRGDNMRGGGLFGILKAIGRAAMPLAKSVVRSVAKRSLNGGINVLNDVVSGSNFTDSVKLRARQQATQAIQSMVTKKRKGQTQAPPLLNKKQKRKQKVIRANSEAY